MKIDHPPSTGGGGGGGSGTVTSVVAANGVETTTGAAITSTGTIRGSHLANSQSGTTYTILTGDRGKFTTCTNASAVAVTLPQAGTGFEDGWYTFIESTGAGGVVITPTTSTINGGATLSLAQYQCAIIVSNGTNYFALVGETSGTSTRLTSLEDTYVRSTRFESIGAGTSGTVSLPANATVVPDDFGGTTDAIVSAESGSRPTYQNAYTAGGAVVATTFDSSGNWSFSGTPSSYPVSVIYRVRQKLKDFDSTSSNIIGGVDFAPLTSMTSAELARILSDETGTGVAVFSASPALTGLPTAPTQSANDNSTKIATTAYADAKVADAINNGTTTIAPSQNAVFDALALKQDLDTQLTSIAGLSYTGNSLKVVRVNAGETDFELATVSGGGGTPGGSDTQVQFNDGGSFGGDAGLTYVKGTDTLTSVNQTITGVIDAGGATSLEIPNSASPTVNADGEIAVDTTVTDFSHGVMKYYGGEEMAVIAVPIAELTSPTNGHVIAYNSANDEFELVAQSGGGGGTTQILGYLAKTANYTITTSDFLIDCTSGTFTVTLPTAIGIEGQCFYIKNSGTGIITVATTSSQTIDGVTTQVIPTQYSGIKVMSNNANWIIIEG